MIGKILAHQEVKPCETSSTPKATKQIPVIDIEEDITIRSNHKCDQCHFETDSKSQLNLHKSGRHSYEPSTAQSGLITCPMCSFNNKSEANVTKHIHEHHPETFTCNKCHQIFSSESELNDHKTEAHTEAYPNSASHPTEINFKCDKCKGVFTTMVNLSKHLTEVHVSKCKVKNTLLLGDSNSKYQNPRLLEKVLGGRGLFTPGCINPRTGRAYCSTKDWPNSRYPDNNLEDKVMEQLAVREHSHLMFGAPCNDISNIGDIQDISEKHRLAVKSSENCIAIAEKALRQFTKLEKVIIPERLPRADHLSDLSEYSNFALRSLAEKSELSKRIVVVPMESLYFTTEEEMSKIFGSPFTSSFDGIHPKGKIGSRLYNKCLISAFRTAGITAPRRRVEEPEAEDIPTSNMFQGLN